jgi:hypothetical protein
MKLKPGDTVRVLSERGTARIRAILTSMHGALLEKEIGGFRNWNLDELRLVKRVNSTGDSRRSMSAEHRAKLKAHWRRTKKRG